MKLWNKMCRRNNYSTWKKRRNIQRIKTSIIKIEKSKIFKLVNDSSVSKIMTKHESK